MHSEQMIISRNNLKMLKKHIGNIIPVGTTSMRVIESLYWLGIDLLKNPSSYADLNTFKVEKLSPYVYSQDQLVDGKESLEAILSYMEQHGIQKWHGETEIFIMPGYEFQVSRGLITNFHMPETTLILLVAALLGEDWRAVYQYAMDNQFRFLSYGDSSLLLP